MRIESKIPPQKINNEIDFNAFYDKFYLKFVKYASWYLNDRAAAEDIWRTAVIMRYSRKKSWQLSGRPSKIFRTRHKKYSN